MSDGVGREWQCEGACRAVSKSAPTVDTGFSELTILFHFIFLERSRVGQLVFYMAYLYRSIYYAHMVIHFFPINGSDKPT